ncbi:hypothetical protein LCGC14_1555600 [marine sediment metagenome]|uniref:Uncharacterized protein n=1 Tax=marine sediment metagenome TaxID=412755 RepID=A0A0F9LPU5_9ZZZZ
MEKEYKWIKIKEIGKSKSGKTLIFVVVNKDYEDVPLGYIKWKPSLRKYGYFPEPKTDYEEDCMGDISNFLIELKTRDF